MGHTIYSGGGLGLSDVEIFNNGNDVIVSGFPQNEKTARDALSEAETMLGQDGRVIIENEDFPLWETAQTPEENEQVARMFSLSGLKKIFQR